MGEKMTVDLITSALHAVSAEIEFLCGKDRLYVTDHERHAILLRTLKSAITAHLATPAQTVDVEAVKTLLELVEGEHGGDHTEADCRHCVAFNKLSQAIGDKT